MVLGVSMLNLKLLRNNSLIFLVTEIYGFNAVSLGSVSFLPLAPNLRV